MTLKLLPPGSTLPPCRNIYGPIGPCLTPTWNGNTRMCVFGGTVYVSLNSPHLTLTACDLDRAAALGHALELT